MYICEGHFLAGFIVIVKDSKPIGSILAVDTDLMVAQRIVGFDPADGSPIVDLIKIDDLYFLTHNMPESVKSLIPANFKTIDKEEK